MAVSRTPGFSVPTLFVVVLDVHECLYGVERGIHYPVHLVVHDMPCRSEVNRIDNLIISVLLVAIQILGLPTMSRVMEEQ